MIDTPIAMTFTELSIQVKAAADHIIAQGLQDPSIDVDDQLSQLERYMCTAAAAISQRKQAIKDAKNTN